LGLDSYSELLSIKDTHSERETKEYDLNSRVRNQDIKEQLDYSDYPTEESESEDSDDSDQNHNLIPIAPVIPPVAVLNQQVPNIPLNRPDQMPDDAPGPVGQRDQEGSKSSHTSESEYHDIDDDIDIDLKEEESDSESEDSSNYQLGPLIDLIEANEEDELLLRELVGKKEASPGNISESSDKNLAIIERLVDLENLIISPYDEVRRQAEFDLRHLLDQYREEQKHPEAEIEGEEKEISIDCDSEIIEEQNEEVRDLVSVKSDTEDSEDKLSKASEKDEEGFDRKSVTSTLSCTTKQFTVPEDSWPCPSERPPMVDSRQRQSVVQIATPGCRITVRPEDIPPEPPPRPREIRGRGRKDIWDWVFNHQIYHLPKN
jgi:hypothetical protein